MKILVGITNYGLKNMDYLHVLIKEYQAMSYNVDILVFSNIPKSFGDDIEVIVGQPGKDPWSLPFAHKKVFAAKSEKYDLFIYTEDDVLIRESNIRAFLDMTEILPENEIAGFIRYELDRNGRRFYPDIHGSYHWEQDSLKRIGDLTFARFSNEHSACYLLTRSQLRKAIHSGGFLVDPYSGRYDMACSASTDPYRRCGFTKQICLSRLQDFLLHHLPNAYINKYGLDSHSFDAQVEALASLSAEEKKIQTLFVTEKKNVKIKWDKNYYEPCHDDVLALVPKKAVRILSVGCGWGATESQLMMAGREVKAIPLDEVISAVAASKGVQMLSPNFDEAFSQLQKNTFDCVICLNVLQYLEKPVHVIRQCVDLLVDGGFLIASMPNFHHIKVYKDLYGLGLKPARIKDFALWKLHRTDRKTVQYWFRQCGLNVAKVSFRAEGRYLKYARLSPPLLKQIFACEMIFLCRKDALAACGGRNG